MNAIFLEKSSITDTYIKDAKATIENLEYPEKHYDDPNVPIKDWIAEWDYSKAKIDIYTHQIHRYPAMFIPQVIRKLLLQYTNVGDFVLDIFNGSGTTTVESAITSRESCGLERNPLAHLIAKVKTTLVDIDLLIESYEELANLYFESKAVNKKYFENIGFWFSPESIDYLSCLLTSIEQINDSDFQDIFKVSFSSIVRDVSLVRHNGFKLHRDEKKLNKKWEKKEIFRLFHDAFIKSLIGLAQLNLRKDSFRQPELKCIDSTKFQDYLEGKADLIITSPPYGDSRTTVAYGQFSRLSSQWLGLIGINGNGSIENIDNKLLGGRRNGIDLEHAILNRSITLKTSLMAFESLILKADGPLKKKLIDRAKDVLAFYIDLEKTIINGSRYLKSGKYFILITGSRIVKGIKLNTDLIIAELGENHGLLLDGILYRKSIPNKRMPYKVSPSNVVGEVAPTMNKESIILLRKE